MNSCCHRWLKLAALCFALLCGTVRLPAADSFVWHKSQDTVDADIEYWPLPQLLENVASTTGWRVYVDPSAIHNVSAKFTNLPFGPALHSLLGDLNFAVVPQTNGPPHLYVFRTTASQATQLVKAPPKKIDSSKPIPNQLIVRLKPGSKTKIDDLARSLGAKVIGRMDAQNAYLLEFDSAAAANAAQAQLASNSDVQSVDYNYPVDPPPPVSLSGTSSSNTPQLNPVTNNGPCQIIVGLIDTPVETLPGNLNSFLQPSLTVAGLPNSSQPDPSQITHGTAMAQVILQQVQARTGGNTSVRIQPVNVYGDSETTSTYDVAAGIVQAVNNGADVINLSLGSSGDSQFLHDTINQVLQQNIPIFAAAGNAPVTTPTYPAAYAGVNAVTASGPNGQIASYANRGSFIDMMAPGDDVVGYDGQSYMVEGTSTASAYASGTAAGMANAAHDCPNQIQSLMSTTFKTVNTTAAPGQ